MLTGKSEQDEGLNPHKVISYLLSRPWSGIDGVVHMGGQVDISNAVREAGSILARAEREPPKSIARLRLEETAADRLREAFRVQWSLPSNQKMLGNGSHLMLFGEKDISELFLNAQRDHAWTLYTRNKLREVSKGDKQKEKYNHHFDDYGNLWH